MIRALMRTTPWLLCAAAFAVSAQAQIASDQDNTSKIIPGQIVVNEATPVVQNMKQDPNVAALLEQAKAVLIVPGYGANPSQLANQAAHENLEGNTSHTTKAMERYGSPGVFLLHSGGWSAPAFFSVSNTASSEQAGEHGMPVVMMFMNSHAAEHMQNADTVSLSGLKVAPYSDSAHGSASSADVVIWTPHGVTHEADLTAAKIHFDDQASNSYYMNQVTLNDILASNVSTTRAVQLQNALSNRVASK
jgi:lipid-binding SYLF domain-containing protein